MDEKAGGNDVAVESVKLTQYVVKLTQVREAVPYVDDFGDVHRNLTKYVMIINQAVVFLTSESRKFNNGYEEYGVPVYADLFGRKWLMIQNRIDAWGGRWWKPLWDDERDPALLEHEVPPPTRWYDERQMEGKRVVGPDGRPRVTK